MAPQHTPDERLRLLIVNDDGIESPMLAPLAARLAPLGEVTIVVPAEEQSWRGKSVTRFGRVTARPVEGLGAPAYAVTGTPSDCVNLAVHHLLPERPHWVVSGINIGSNVGSAYVIHSGTIGAALEGHIQGIPSAAFSTYLPPRQFREWMQQRTLASPENAAVVAGTTERTAAMMATLIERGSPCPGAVLNVNFPGAVAPQTPVHWVPLQRSRYGSLFRADGEGFVHAAVLPLDTDDNHPTDRSVVLAGHISVTAIDYTGLGMEPPPPAQRPF